MSSDAQKVPVNIEDEMKSSFIDYAMSVIISRAIPDVRDGLKPVHRRILYAMHLQHNTASSAYKKAARIVGDVLGKFHPHGDLAVYDALVRLAQDWSVRYPLIDGQGNFGSMDGDAPAAMRYTEVRMTRLAGELLADIEKETVDFVPNYDDKEVEPTVLPARVPNLLVNGSSGIAVGMATNIPPHNLREVVNATIALIKDPTLDVPALMKHVPAPDFPTAGLILGREGIRQAYTTGRGSIVMRARTSFEKLKSGREAIIVSELPYQVNKARLLEKIAELVRDKRIDGISDVHDESNREGVRVVVELKRDAVGEVVLNQLFKLTPLQESFGVTMLAIVGRRPRLLTLKDALEQFIDHRRVVVTRRTTFELHEAEKRHHILEGLRIALDNLDAVIELIRRAPDADAARAGLVGRFGLSEVQAQAILDMRLARLTGLERDKILEELKAVAAEIVRLRELLADDAKLMALIASELELIRDQYGDERRTQVVDEAGEISLEDMIADEEMIVTVTHSGYIKRNPPSLYRAQHRGGRGIAGMDTKEEDFVAQLFVASTHSHVLMLTSLGRIYAKKVYEIPQASRTARGKAIANLLDLKPGESVVQIIPVREFKEGSTLLMATRAGVVKKTDLMDFSDIRASGIIGISIDDGDKLIGAAVTDGTRHALLATRTGSLIRFPEETVRAMGRVARGVIGIRLEEGDAVVSLATLDAESKADILTVCENGFGKRTPAEEYRTTNRGGVGIITIKTTERNGPVVAVRPVEGGEHLMVITDKGTIIRMPVGGISQVGRAAQGVRLVRLDEGEKVAAVELLAEPEDAATPPAEPPPADT